MSDGDGPLALRLVTDHIADCTQARKDTKDAICDVRNLLIRFIAGVVTVVVAFAGYTYVQDQNVEHQLVLAQAQQAAEVAQIPAKTAKAVSATIAPPPQPSDN